MSERHQGRLRIVDYDPRWQADFARLNLEWLERWFSVEPVDRAVLGDPETHVLADGGRILFALDEDRVVGTVALKHEGEGVYELTKMAVDPSVRGGGIGRRLVEAALQAYRDADGRRLHLETNSRLEPAIRLYESVGFVHRAPDADSPYARADVAMDWAPQEPSASS